MQTRRDFLKVGASSVGCAYVAAQTPMLFGAEATAEPHFFLQIIIPGGVDPSYFFDARPLEMTAAKLIQNYSGTEAILYTGSNGQQTWRSQLMNPLMPYMNKISVINGVHMVAAFDGHPQNMNFLLTGNAFGGEGQLPHFNMTGKKLPLDYLEVGGGFFGADLQNAAGSARLSVNAARNLSEKFRNAPALAAENSVLRQMRKRTANLQNNTSGLAQASWLLDQSLDQTPQVNQLLKNINLAETKGAETMLQSISMVGELFRGGLARSAMYVFDQFRTGAFIDTHSIESAKNQPKVYGDIANDLASVMKHLSETPFDDKRSLFDVTTVMVCSEFARTMRQSASFISFESTGTDHNQYSNSFLIGGKGIRGGLVLGATDMESIAACQKEAISGAHLAVDRENLMAIGKPFNVATATVSSDRPAEYKAEHYLNCASVANALYDAFGCDKKFYRSMERNGPPVPSLKALLA